MRSAMVMSPDRGGVFDTLRTLVRRGLGGRAGSGRQFVSWIHDVDFANARSRLLIEHEDLEGPVNLAAPNPLPYSDFMAALRKAEGIPFGLPSTKWMLEPAPSRCARRPSWCSSRRRVVPGALMRSGLHLRASRSGPRPPGISRHGGERRSAATPPRISSGNSDRSTRRTSDSGRSSGAKKLS